MKVTRYLEYYVGICRKNALLQNYKDKGVFNSYLIHCNVSELPEEVIPDDKISKVIQGGLCINNVTENTFSPDVYDCEYHVNTGKLKSVYDGNLNVNTDDDKLRSRLDEIKNASPYVTFYKQYCHLNFLLEEANQEGIHHFYYVPLSNSDTPGIIIPNGKVNLKSQIIEGTLMTLNIIGKTLEINHYDCKYNLTNGDIKSRSYQRSLHSSTASFPFKIGDEFEYKNHKRFVVYSVSGNKLKAYSDKQKTKKFKPDDPFIKKIDWLKE